MKNFLFIIQISLTIIIVGCGGSSGGGSSGGGGNPGPIPELPSAVLTCEQNGLNDCWVSNSCQQESSASWFRAVLSLHADGSADGGKLIYDNDSCTLENRYIVAPLAFSSGSLEDFPNATNAIYEIGDQGVESHGETVSELLITSTEIEAINQQVFLYSLYRLGSDLCFTDPYLGLATIAGIMAHPRVTFDLYRSEWMDNQLQSGLIYEECMVRYGSSQLPSS